MEQKVMPKYSESDVGKAEEVYFYATCVVNVFASQAGIAAVKVLELLGVEVDVPSGQTCCGQPGYNSGYQDAARRVAMAQLELFSEDKAIVIPSGSCGAMMQKHYEHLFRASSVDEELGARVKHFSRRIVEWNDFIIRRLTAMEDNSILMGKQEQEEVTVVFHPSCHSLRELRTAGQARKLLSLLPGVRVLELPHAQECCGFGGVFAVNHPMLSTAMADNKIRELTTLMEKEEIHMLCSNDYSCLMHLEGRLRREKIDVRVGHMAEFIGERVCAAL